MENKKGKSIFLDNEVKKKVWECKLINILQLVAVFFLGIVYDMPSKQYSLFYMYH